MTLTKARLLLAASGCALMAPHAYSQENTERLDTVIVTAPGPERTADELIGNATAIPRDEIVTHLAASLGDTLDHEPGVASTFFGQGASRPVLRGLGAERVQVLTNGIGVIDASAASPDHQVASDGIDAERIEILRGPAALAYGGQAIGGVVNVVDGLIAEELPEKPMSGDIFGAYNSVSEGTELGGRAQFTTGPFVLSLSASQRDFGDYDIPGFAESDLLRSMEEMEEEDHDHEEEEDHDHEGEEHEEIRDTMENSFVDTETLSAGLSWVGDNAFLGIAIRQQTAQYGLPGHSHEHEHEHEHEDEEDHEDGDHEEEEEHEHEEEHPFIDLEQQRIDIRGGVTVNYGILTDILGTLAIADYEHTEFEAPGEPGTVYKTDGVEGRIEVGHAIGELKGAFGLQYLDKDFGAFGEESFISPTTTQSTAAFLYETREWDSGFGIEGGARFESVDYDNDVFGTNTFDIASGSFGLHQHFDSGLFLGAQLSYTERAPNESELFADGAHLATVQYEVGNPGMKEESGLNLEGTARWRGERGSVGINLFATEFSDFIYLTPGTTMHEGELVDEVDGVPVFLFVQDDATFTGGEIYGDYNVGSVLGADWYLDGSLDFVSAELDDGGNLPYLPPVSVNAGVTADWGLWELGASTTFAAEQDDPGAGELPTDGYTTLDLHGAFNLSEVGIGAPGTQFFVDLRNATDEEVRYSTSVLKDKVPAPGRNLRIGVRAAF